MTVVLLEDNVSAVTREMVKEKYGVVTRERIGRAQSYPITGRPVIGVYHVIGHVINQRSPYNSNHTIKYP